MRIDLTDTTFIIPVRIDSMIRLENLLRALPEHEALNAFHRVHADCGNQKPHKARDEAL